MVVGEVWCSGVEMEEWAAWGRKTCGVWQTFTNPTTSQRKSKPIAQKVGRGSATPSDNGAANITMQSFYFAKELLR